MFENHEVLETVFNTNKYETKVLYTSSNPGCDGLFQTSFIRIVYEVHAPVVGIR